MMEHRQERALFLKPPDYGRGMIRTINNIQHRGWEEQVRCTFNFKHFCMYDHIKNTRQQ